MSIPLRLLLVEDNEDDAFLVERVLTQGGFQLQTECVENAGSFSDALDRQEWDLIIADYSLPGFNGLAALALLRKTGKDVPFIIVSGAIGEDVAVQGMKAGAHDYLLKGNLSRLVPAVTRELREAGDRRERRRAEAALRENAQRLQLHVSKTPLAVIEWNVNFEVTAWNPAAERIFGYPAAEILGKRGDFILPAAARAGIEAIWKELIAGKGGLRNTNQNVTECGRLIECEWYNTTLIDEAGRIIGVASLAQDVTERKHAEESLRELGREWQATFDAMNEAVALVELDGTVRRCNRAMAELCGVPACELSGKHCYALIHHLKQPQEGCPLVRMCKSCERETLVLQHGDRWLDVVCDPLFDQHGQLTGAVHIASDITDRKLAEELRARLENQLRQSQKMEAIGTLAGGIAHDFNNILAAIIPYTHLAKSDAADNVAVQESLDQVLQAADRARNLVQQILAFSRKQKQERHPVKVQEVIREALLLLRSALPATIEIQAEIQEDAPAIRADPTQLHQVLMNLCTNAEHAMRGVVGTLGVRLKRVEVEAELARTQAELRPGPYLKLTVSDTGHGMDSEILKRVFDPFFTTKAPGAGTGLGLSVVHGIVKEHEGAILVSSRPEQGSVFDVYLPIQAAEVAASPSAPVVAPQGRGEHILLVDDEPAICKVARRMLERQGYQVTAHSNPLSALAEFQANPKTFDLLLTDLTMPGMTGVDLALRALELRPTLPIILATGFGGVWTTESARRLGIREVVMKPIAPEAFAGIIHQALRPPPD